MSFKFKGFLFFSTLLFIEVLSLPSFSKEAYSFSEEVSFESKDLSLPELSKALSKARTKNPEFKEIKKIAEELGVRVWLFGGTASSFAHYVKWNLERLKGDTKYQKEYFDYDYTNIYRSTQDMDLVIDGNDQQARELESRLSQKFPYFQGSKEVWEVRLLNEKVGDKEALLNSHEFLKQHTDSNSTGMIELTKSKDPIVRDLRDWESEKSKFLKDVRSDQISYYFSENHKSTQRYKEGLNPEIMSVIRYFTKLFQYGLSPRQEDLPKLRKIIDEFKPQKLTTGYAKGWIENNGKKLMFHAVDVEYAWNVLEEFGLRQKLIRLGDKTEENSLSWWLNKEPLRDKPVGKGKGKTAKELGINTIAHETKDFMAYEIITKSKKGMPNVFISREGISGEAAALGDGFYTMIGKEGSRGTGFTIRFQLDPKSREGTDFIKDEDMLIIRNKRAIQTIPESLNIGFREFFEILVKGENDWDKDRGLLEKLKRKISNQITSERVSQKDADYVYKMIRKIWLDLRNFNETPLRKWFSLKISLNYPELPLALIDKKDQYVLRRISNHVLSQPHWVEKISKEDKDSVYKRVRETLLSNEDHEGFFEDWFSLKISSNYPNLVQILIQKGGQKVFVSIVEHVLSQPHWKDHPEWVQVLIKKGGKPVLESIAWYVLAQPHWKDHPELVQALIKKADQKILKRIVHHVLTQPHWKDHPEWVQALIKKGDQDVLIGITRHVLSKPHWKDHPELVQALINKGEPMILRSIAVNVLSQPHWKDHPELVQALVDKRDKKALRYIAWYVLSEPHWKDHPFLRRITGGRKPTVKNLKKAIESDLWDKEFKKYKKEREASLNTKEVRGCKGAFL